ncbi:30S ribosomal protein S12 methylthiotransferase RimO [Pseudobacteroides cellulosolvens]|uniref:Ribosomal protein uS12 methylthiotransferase RimO n=1 Tax=Pseudobacteroides cellulosolvens ATCC 35603 = DSM 2933 TaxID=398512 RepID=A0A0L6JK01_9FIRM|nr:30S ribosomal protein S12 methylthiotransferase RimO [Pseudobacteroides cellulosolvens]KNY26043.1 Ribosomal protein S12 methylthiotransferase rimO [Pseudobacteroides cellulosolvens ATCC 35603 = DSM 2933]
MKKKIGVISLGCPKNLIDSEIMLGLIKNCEYEIVNEKEEAQILIVNTCGFIESAKQESINTILEMAECKKDRCELLIVTGCLAERYKGDIINEIPEVDACVGTGNVALICDVIEKAYKGEKQVLYGKLDDTSYLNTERVVSTKNGFAYLKIAEGCDNCCTYCIIPSLRGRFRSRNMEDVLLEAESLSKNGAKEIILVAQDTTRYGLDIYGKKMLSELLRKLSSIDDVKWIRLLYCYPEEIDEELVNEISQNNKVLKYLDIPFQHASDKVLKAMGRRGTSNEYKKLIMDLRSRIPGIVLRTSVIVGFPGETEEDFNELYKFFSEYKVDRLGVFSYSREENTPASKYKNQISSKTIKKRFDLMMDLQKETMDLNNSFRLDKIYPTIVEGVADDGIFYIGRTYAEAPDIDSLIYFTSEEPVQIGDIVKVKIMNIDNYDLIGAVTNEFTE